MLALFNFIMLIVVVALHLPDCCSDPHPGVGQPSSGPALISPIHSLEE